MGLRREAAEFQTIPSRIFACYTKAVYHFAMKAFRKRDPAAKAVQIEKGTTSTVKYQLFIGQEIYFVRVYPFYYGRTVRVMFDTVKQLAEQGCDVPPPISIIRRFPFVYHTEPWINGTTLKESLGMLAGDKQYEAGLAVSSALKRFREARITHPLEPLMDRLRRTINTFRQSPHSLFGLKEKFLSYIVSFFPVLEKRPQVLLHGDLHLKNIMLAAEHQPLFIDFGLICMGDPLYDVICLLERNEGYKWFNRGVLDGLGVELTLYDWRIMGCYYVIRKIGEYLQCIQSLPEHLASREGWEERYVLLTDPNAMRAAVLFEEHPEDEWARGS